jgi:hypothetical protein
MATKFNARSYRLPPAAGKIAIRSASNASLNQAKSQMSKFACTCGHVISDVQCPNEVTGWLLSAGCKGQMNQ